MSYGSNMMGTITGPKLCDSRVYQNMTFPARLSEDREEFLLIKEILPYPTDFLYYDSYMHEIHTKINEMYTSCGPHSAKTLPLTNMFTKGHVW